MKNERAIDAAPAQATIRATLERVVASAELAKSPQLVNFLRFVVEAELSGQSRHIKAYTIATDALGRDARFDPQLDPIVRVEAGRLRRALKHYYQTEGRDEPLVIELPLGSYVPVFRRRGQKFSIGEYIASSIDFVRRQLPPEVPLRAVLLWGAVGAATVALLLDAVVVDRLLDTGVETTTRAAVVTDATAPASRSFLPRLRIEPVVTIGKADPQSTVSESIQQFLVDLGAGNDDIVTLIGPKPRDGNNGNDNAFAAATMPPSYTLTPVATYRGDGSVRVGLALTHDTDGALVWSRDIPDFMALTNAQAQNRVTAQNVSAALFSWFGVIHGRERAKRSLGSNLDPRYACLLDAQVVLRHFDAEHAVSARGCLERAIAKDPDFEPGLALLARLYAWIYLFGTDALRQEAPPLAEAAKLAQRAIDLDFDSAKAHTARFILDFMSGDIAGGIAHGERAHALYPNDATVTVNFAIQLILAGAIQGGGALLGPADSTLTSRPARVYFVRFLVAYLDGDMPGASMAAQKMLDETMTWTHLARALVAARGGDLTTARRDFERLVAIQSGWRSDPRGELRRFIHSPEIIERIAGDLATIKATASN